MRWREFNTKLCFCLWRQSLMHSSGGFHNEFVRSNYSFWAGLPVATLFSVHRPFRGPRLRHPQQSSFYLLGCLHAALLRQKGKENTVVIGQPQSLKGGLRNDVVSIAVRPRPVGDRRERFLVKLCGGKEKRFGCVSTQRPWRPEIQVSF